VLLISESKLFDINDLRTDYLNSLPFFQDIWLELMIRKALCYEISFNKLRAGYAIFSSENILLELYLDKNSGNYYRQVFKHLTGQLQITAVYCKSFDAALYSHCSKMHFHRKLIGYLYRDYSESEVMNTILSYRFADQNDLEFLQQQDDEVFEPKEFLPSLIDSKSIIFFYDHNSIAACGFMTRIHENWNYYDIGMWVHPAFRKKGYGNYVFGFLKKFCIENSMIPLCGCGCDNEISQKIIEINGFTSHHELFEFKIK